MPRTASTTYRASADDILGYMTQLNLSAAELRLQPVEAYLKAPTPWVAPRTAGRGAERTPLTPEQKAEQAAVAQAQEKWRLSQSMDGFKAFRKKYEDAGVLIQIVKYDGINTFKDDVVDYCFQVAKALGAYAISCEIPVSQTERLGAFAAKHKMMVGYHGHGNLTDPEAFGRLGAWEQAFTYSKYNGANVDIGHFFAATGTSPAAWIKEHHERVTHVHIKDRKANNGPNMPFGQGDTPIKEILTDDEEGKVQVPGHHRDGIPGAGRLHAAGGNRQVRALLPGHFKLTPPGRRGGRWHRDCSI